MECLVLGGIGLIFLCNNSGYALIMSDVVQHIFGVFSFCVHR